MPDEEDDYGDKRDYDVNEEDGIMIARVTEIGQSAA
jgi:hypothetical protein